MKPPRAMILAAGRGERMRPLTDRTPKPLLRVRGKPLVEWHLEALARAGIREVTINTAWLESQFPAVLGDGSRFGLAIRYAMEGRDHGGALETAGGIAHALSGLAEHAGQVFWIISGDVFMPGFRFAADDATRFEATGALARLWLAPNPEHHPAGDFGIDPRGRAFRVAPDGQGAVGARTWTGAGLFRAEMFHGIAPGTRLALRPLLERALDAGRLEAAPWNGEWTDVGTPGRLAALNAGATVGGRFSPS